MKPEKQISDQQLDHWLRDVQVPTELKSTLGAIPDRDSNQSSMSRSNRKSHTMDDRRLGRKFWLGLLGLAASIALIVVVLNWPAAMDDGNSGHADKGEDVEPMVPIEPVPTDNDSQGKLETELSDLSVHFEVMELWTTRVEIQRLEEKLRKLRGQGAYSLGIHEDASLILALADQVSVALGASEDSATADMNQVIKTYPNSRGAQIAKDYLASQAN